MNGDAIEVAARALSDAASLALFGAALLATLCKRDARAMLRALALLALGATLLATGCVVVAVALGAEIGAASLPMIVLDTAFGRVWLMRCVLTALAAAFAMGAPEAPLIAFCAALNLIALAFLGHAAARAEVWGPTTIALHVLAGGAWLGGLVLLLRRPTEPLEVRVFSRVGYAAASLIPLAGLTALFLITHAPMPNLATAYGRLAAVKLGLYAVLLALALFNRFVAAPRADWALMRQSVTAELAVMATLVTIAATLSATAPEG